MNHDAQHEGGTGPSEDELRRLLNAAVDDELGARRPAPVFDPARRPSTGTFRRSVRFGVPLLAAAAIVAIAATGVAVTRHNGSSRPAAPPANSTTEPGRTTEPTTGGSNPTTLPPAPSTRSTGATAPTGSAGSTGSTSGPNTGPTGVPTRGSTTLDFTGYGNVSLGMTAGQVAQAQPTLARNMLGNGCTQFFRSPSQGFFNVVLTPPANRVIGIAAPADRARTSTGIATGATEAQIRGAYSQFHIETANTQAGTTVLIQGPSSWLSFDLSADGRVTQMSVGTKKFVSHYEICVGTQR